MHEGLTASTWIKNSGYAKNVLGLDLYAKEDREALTPILKSLAEALGQWVREGKVWKIRSARGKIAYVWTDAERERRKRIDRERNPLM